MLNEALNVVAVKGYEKVGEVVLVKECSTTTGSWSSRTPTRSGYAAAPRPCAASTSGSVTR
jgi:hypothetical protein